MRKKIKLGLLLIGVFFVTCSSMLIQAGSQTRYEQYAGLNLECYIKCTSNYGEGSNPGAQMDGYRNYIKVNTYNNNGVRIDYAEEYTILKASVRASKGPPYSARTFHAAANYENIQILPTYQQIQQAQGR